MIDAVPPTTPYQVEICDDVAPAGLESTWNRLFEAVGSEPSTSLEWTAALSQSHLEPDDQLLLLRIYDQSTVRGLLPLAVRRRRRFGYPITTIAPISEWYNTHSDALLADRTPSMVEALIRGLLASTLRWDVFRMDRLLEASPLLAALERGLEAVGARHRTHWTDPSYVLTLPGSFEEYLSSRSQKFRSHLKRTARKLDERGARVLDLSAIESFDTAFEMLLHVERRSWKHGRGTAISAVPRQMQFYRRMGAVAASRGRLHLHFLMLNDEPVAHNFGYISGDTYSYLKTSYVDEVRSLGAATYLRARLVRELIDRNVAILDFPAEPYEWERQWTSELRWHKALLVFNATPAGRVLHVATGIRRATSQRARERVHAPSRPGTVPMR